MNLHEILDDAAAGLDGVDVAAAPDGALTWSHHGRPFATLAADGAAEFGLDPTVAAAASRTPDVSGSGRGPGWVRFHPLTLDGHAADRARAWLQSAHRHAVD